MSKKIQAVVIAGTSSNVGKTVITMAIARAIKNRNIRLSALKVGPDYIDLQFLNYSINKNINHKSYINKNICENIDLWAMSEKTIDNQLENLKQTNSTVIIEGVMGLFDGNKCGESSTADVALKLSCPIILVVNCEGATTSICASVKGFQTFDERVKISCVILNKVASKKHFCLLKNAFEKHLPNIEILGYIPKLNSLKLENRHLGLIQAMENENLEAFIENAAKVMEDNLNIDKIIQLSKQLKTNETDIKNQTENETRKIEHLQKKPAGKTTEKRIAIAYDQAFSFVYPHFLNSLRQKNIKISFFSPLNNEEPDNRASCVFLPGGYPELHLEKLVKNKKFFDGTRNFVQNEKTVFAECGGFMVMGNMIVDKHKNEFEMLALLPILTTLENPRLKLDYLNVKCLCNVFPSLNIASKGDMLRGHVFHYATAIKQKSKANLFETNAAPLFETTNCRGEDIKLMGLQNKTAFGSFIHIIDYHS